MTMLTKGEEVVPAVFNNKLKEQLFDETLKGSESENQRHGNWKSGAC